MWFGVGDVEVGFVGGFEGRDWWFEGATVAGGLVESGGFGTGDGEG